MRSGGGCLRFFLIFLSLKKIRHLPHYVVIYLQGYTNLNTHKQILFIGDYKHMKILIGCEESGRVREAFRGVGHDAWSCDLLPCTENPSKYHIQDDLLKVIKSEKWDMIIAFPPCTHLAISGAKYFPEKIADGRQQAAIDFVEAIWDADCPKIAIENPVGVLSTKSKLGKPSYIQPYWFGEKQRKKTGLWLKGLPKLVPTDMVDISKVSEKELNKLYYLAPSPTRALERSKTFHGVANAMAQQWGGLV